MPGNHGKITVVEQNRVVNDSNKTREKKTKEEDAVENGNQLVTPSVSKPRKQFTDRFRKKHKSRSGSSCKGGGCFSMMRPRGTEEDGSLSSSSQPSDPNDECFTHDMLRVMLEKNDFFSDECNPHR
ncbi:Ubiquitin carboxyl-terminal hydrolase-like protein [Hirschfeldia incana]|nr:Ubiquitin carboxyl-terminal hydrolase-like protein [Hirschfeldia incana]